MTSVNYDLLNALIIIGIIACIIFIIAMLYLIFVLTRTSILSKKVDYLVEDLTYKSEKLNITVDAIVKLSNYINVFESYFNNNTQNIINYIDWKLKLINDVDPKNNNQNKK